MEHLQAIDLEIGCGVGGEGRRLVEESRATDP